MKKTTKSGEIVVSLAEQLYRLDSFFNSFSRDKRINDFLCENKTAVYSEISFRIINGYMLESFGSFDNLLDQAVEYLNGNNYIDNSKSLIAKVKRINKKRKAVGKIIDVSKKHGTDWIPKEFRKRVVYSLIALPTMFVVYESIRASVITALFKSNVEEFTNFILGLYVLIAFIGFIQEQRTLKQHNSVVFNPYANLLALGLSTELSGLLARIPRHITELGAIFGAIITQKQIEIPVLVPVLSAVIATLFWSSSDIVFNYGQEKILKRKNSKNVYNLD